MSPTAIVAYLTLFVTVGIVFLFVALLLGRFLRPIAPSAEKLETYECGEPPVGSSFVQFDLRFYVVALLFIIFEVEIAFFFPPAVVFGILNQIRTQQFLPGATAADATQKATENASDMSVAEKFSQLGVSRLTPSPEAKELDNPVVLQWWQSLSPEKQQEVQKNQIRTLAATAMIDMGVFFVVLLVGFAYLWNRGDLNWVRAAKGFGIQGSGFGNLSEDYPPIVEPQIIYPVP
jgi:NADH-quinone oxidoreductase subunit A